MVKSEFKIDGTIYCRGEAAYQYKAGEKVMILNEINDDTVEVLVLEGEGEGITMPTEKSLLKL